ncbi:hypothetical protein GCM10027614_71870 [Micromonospora vulcania]
MSATGVNVTLAAEAATEPVSTTPAVAATNTATAPSVTGGRGNRMSIQDLFSTRVWRVECRKVDEPTDYG